MSPHCACVFEMVGFVPSCSLMLLIFFSNDTTSLFVALLIFSPTNSERHLNNISKLGSYRTKCMSIPKPKRSLLLREIITVYSENHKGKGVSVLN
jgi:hypothetical protein